MLARSAGAIGSEISVGLLSRLLLFLVAVKVSQRRVSSWIGDGPSIARPSRIASLMRQPVK
jgi:hypothetical protein